MELSTGVKVRIKKGRIEVVSGVLERNPLLKNPIGITKFRSKFIPSLRITLNEWFLKHF